MPQSRPAQRQTGADRRPSRAAAIVTAAVYACLSLFLAVGAYIGWDGPGSNDLAPAGGAAIGGHAALACVRCHADDPAKTETGANGLVPNHENLCTGCHRGAIEASHPSGFRPERPLPAAFPLDAAGRMTCATCHAFHEETPALLRMTRVGEAFCRSCHDHEFFDSMPDRGESLLMAGHFDATARPWTGFDPYSLRCMICHDDRAQSRPQIASSGFSDMARGPRAGDPEHPIGRDYDEAARSRDYRPRTFLAEEMLLPGGRVACVSCHVPYSRDHGRAPRTSGGVCQECHVM